MLQRRAFFIVFITLSFQTNAMQHGVGSNYDTVHASMVHQQKSYIDQKKVASLLSSSQLPNAAKELICGFKNVTTMVDALPRATLFYGTPGNGKSALVKAIAIKSKIPFIFVNCTRLGTKFQNSSSEKLEDLLFLPRNDTQNHYVVILEEAEALFGVNDEKSRLNPDGPFAFLTLFDEIKEKNNKVFWFATTNRYDNFSDPVKSRFDEIIEIKNPSLDDRKAVLGYYLNLNTLAQHQTALINNFAEKTSGFSCRDLEKAARKAKLNHGLRSKNQLSQMEEQDINQAIQHIAHDPLFQSLHPTWVMSMKKFLGDNKSQIIPALSLGIGIIGIYATYKQYTLSRESAEISKQSFLLSVDSAKIAKKSLEIAQKGLDLQQKAADNENMNKLIQAIISIASSISGSSAGTALSWWLNQPKVKSNDSSQA